MIDIFAKKILCSKRQVLYLFYILLRYIRIKESLNLSPQSQVAGKVLYIISGRAPHTNFESKKVIEAIYKVMKLVNEDPAASKLMRIVFIPNFSIALCEQYVAAGDLS